MKQEENELLAKLKEVNLANSEYAKELDEINERKIAAAENEANPFKTFSTLQNNIAEEEKKQQDEKMKQQMEADAAIKAEEAHDEEETVTEEQLSEEQPAEQAATEQVEAPKKKTSLQSLLSSAKNLKK